MSERAKSGLSRDLNNLFEKVPAMTLRGRPLRGWIRLACLWIATGAQQSALAATQLSRLADEESKHEEEQIQKTEKVLPQEEGQHRKEWPPWWKWELDITKHVHKRMPRRDFTEIDLRRMMEHAYRPDVVEGRWIVETRLRRQHWEIIVEPIPEKKLLTVVTAYDVSD